MSHPQEKSERNLRIYKMRLLGISYRELSNEYGITQQRIRQIFKSCDAKEKIFEENSPLRYLKGLK